MISIIIPTHNEETTIAKQIRNIRSNFTDIPHELIISDDNSDDNTVKEASPYADQVVSNPSTARMTIGANRNQGAKAARYPYIAFTDGGVEIPNMNNFFRTLLDRFEKMPDVVGITVNIRFFPAVETKTDKIILKSYDFWFRFCNNVLKTGAANGKFQMVRAEAFKKIGGYDETLVASEDFDLFRRLAKIGRTYSEPSLTVYHSGRRAHQVGWFKLLPIWIFNGIWVLFFKRSLTKKEWKDVR